MKFCISCFQLPSVSINFGSWPKMAENVTCCNLIFKKKTFKISSISLKFFLGDCEKKRDFPDVIQVSLMLLGEHPVDMLRLVSEALNTLKVNSGSFCIWWWSSNSKRNGMLPSLLVPPRSNLIRIIRNCYDPN